MQQCWLTKNTRAEFGKERVKVHATFDSEPYEGSVVNMGLKNADGSVCYIIGIRKDIRAKIGKQAGNTVQVSIKERKWNGKFRIVTRTSERSAKSAGFDNKIGEYIFNPWIAKALSFKSKTHKNFCCK